MTTTEPSETPAQFRARLRIAYRRGFEAQANAMAASDATPTFSAIGECRASGCEAVYAEALRDVKAYALQNREHPRSPSYRAHELIDRFAATRGIDLSESEGT